MRIILALLLLLASPALAQTCGCQGNGNVHAYGPNSQVKMYGTDAGLWAGVTQATPNYSSETYLSGGGYVNQTGGGLIERKWYSISTHLVSLNDDSFQTVMRLNNAGIDANGTRGDDLWLRGWSHHGAAFFHPTDKTEFDWPGYKRLNVGGPVKIESGEHGNDAMLRLNSKNAGKTYFAIQNNGTGAAAIGLQGAMDGSTSGNLAVFADENLDIVFMIGATVMMRIKPNGQISDKNGTVIGGK